VLASKVIILQGRVVWLFCRTLGMLRRTLVRSVGTGKKNYFYVRVDFWIL